MGMEKIKQGLRHFFVKILKVLNYRICGISEVKWEYWCAVMLIVFSLVTFILELVILGDVGLIVFILNMISLFKRICEFAIENNRLKREYYLAGKYDGTRKSSYTLLLLILIPLTLFLLLMGGLLTVYLYRNSDENGVRPFFYVIVLSNMVINLCGNILNAVVALYQAEASYGESEQEGI